MLVEREAGGGPTETTVDMKIGKLVIQPALQGGETRKKRTYMATRMRRQIGLFFELQKKRKKAVSGNWS